MNNNELNFNKRGTMDNEKNYLHFDNRSNIFVENHGKFNQNKSDNKI